MYYLHFRYGTGTVMANSQTFGPFKAVTISQHEVIADGKTIAEASYDDPWTTEDGKEWSHIDLAYEVKRKVKAPLRRQGSKRW